MLALVAAVLLLLLLCWSRRRGALPGRGRIVLISGCDSGLGLHFARHLTQTGCTVVAGCLNTDSHGAQALKGLATVIKLDVTNDDSVRQSLRQIEQDFPEIKSKGLWALINNAGVCTFGEFEWLTLKQCQNQIDVNLLGTLRLTKVYQPFLRKAKGRIINISSVNGSVAYPGISVYSATKFALVGFSEALRREMVPHHVKVILFQPGDFAKLTNILSGHQTQVDGMWDGMDSEQKEFYRHYFHKYHEQVVRHQGLFSPSNLESSSLLPDMEHAVLSKKPKSKYISATLPYRFIVTLMLILPSCWVDIILVSAFRAFLKK